MNTNEHEALSVIVEDMERDANSMDNEPGCFSARDLRSYMRQINLLLKMSKPAETIKIIPAEVQHQIEIDKARAEFRNKKNNGMKAADFMPRASVEEDMIGGMSLLRGGTNHGASVPSAKQSDPPGTHVVFGDEVFTLAPDRNFDYNEEETVVMRRTRLIVK